MFDKLTSYIFKLSTPVTAQADPIHINILITATLQMTVPLILNVHIRFLIQFTDGRGRVLEFLNLEGNSSRSGGEIVVVVAAAVTLASLATLIPDFLSQFPRLSLQQFIEGLLYAASHQFPSLPLDNFLV